MEVARKWEKRWHPLRQEWIVYAAHRNTRPWSGASVGNKIHADAYHPTCYLCPGNKRISGKKNPDYKGVFVFDNDHPVVGEDAPEIITDSQNIYKKSAARGIARVVCYDPRHNVSMADLGREEIAAVFNTWRLQTKDLMDNPMIHSVLIFENRGEAVGVSNPHPHCQIYATDFGFELVSKSLLANKEYLASTGQNLFETIIKEEQKQKVRIIAENEEAIAFVPFFARYAYEVMVFPKKKAATLVDMSNQALEGMAVVFREVVRRYDQLYQMPFPYVMSILQAPVNGETYQDYHLYMLLQPPLRQPGLIKYLAGPEIGAGNFMADTMPEEKAAELQKTDISAYKF